jgi:hypothetical protein
MSGGQLQQSGGILSAIGAIVSLIPGAQPIGLALMAAGVTLDVAGAFITPVKPDTGSDSKRDSPTYGFAGAKFKDRFKGDAPIPFQYGRLKQALVVSQAFTTPRGLENLETFTKSKGMGQGVSMELIGGEGPIQSIEDIRYNDKPLFARYANADGTPKQVAVSPGGNAAWSVAIGGTNKARIYLPSIKLYVNGIDKGWILTTLNYTCVGTGARSTYSIPITDTSVLEHATEYSLIFTAGGTGLPIDIDDPTTIRPFAWIDGTGNARKIYIDFGYPLENGQNVNVQYVVRRMSDLITITTDSDGVTTANWPAKVGSVGGPPASGAKITVLFDHYTLPWVNVELRYGGEHQLPLTGFNDVRHTQKVGGEVTSSGNRFTTTQPVDDVVVDFATNALGIHSTDKTDGSIGPIQAMIRIKYKPSLDSAGNPTNDGAYITLEDPAGANSAFSDAKPATVFALWGETTAQEYWSFSVRNILKQLAAKQPNSTWPTRLGAFTRQTYDFLVERTNVIRHNDPTNGAYFADQIDLVSYQEVLDEWLTHPMTWKIGFHGLGSAYLNGALPNMTCVPTGLTSVRTIITVNNVDSWGPAIAAAQFNPVWAACDLFANKIYGGGPQYQLSDIDMPSAKAAAAWCDQQVAVDGSSRFVVVSGVSVVAPATFRRSSDSWINDGYYVGQQVQAQGFTQAAANGLFTVSSVTATDLVVVGSMTAEGPAVGKTVRPSGQVRGRLDYSGDTRGSLLSHMADMLAPSFVIPVLQGNKLKFVVDRALTDAELAAVPVIYDDDSGDRTLSGPDALRTIPGAGADHQSPVDDMTELYVTFYDELLGWTDQPVIVASHAPAPNRRVKRMEIKGCTRVSQATRYAQLMYAQATAAPSIPGLTLTAKPRIDLEAGDVVRFVSQRLDCDVYLRIHTISFDSGDYFIRLETKEYRPEVYGQQSHARILAQPRLTSTPSVVKLVGKATKVWR